MELQYVNIIKYKEQLKNASKYNEVEKISQDLFFMKIDIDVNFNKFEESCNDMREICKLLLKFLLASKSQSFQKTIMKTAIKLSIQSLEKFHEQMVSKYNEIYGELPAIVMESYGWLQNVKFPYDLSRIHDSFVDCSLKYSKNTSFFALAIENYIQAYDLKLIDKNNEFITIVIINNLENGHRYIHKLLLELFHRVIKIAEKNEEEMIMKIIMNDMSFYNRNKFYLLSHLIVVKQEMLLNHSDFDLVTFLKGLRIGLSQYHLYASSSTLIKHIYEKTEFREELIKIFVDILVNGSDEEVDNFLKLWFSVLDSKYKDEMFKLIKRDHDFSKVTSVSKNFRRSLIIRNAFAKTLNSKLDNSIKEFSCCSIPDDVRLKIEIYNFLVNEVYVTSNDMAFTFENILRLLKFLQFNMCTENSVFIDNVVKLLPRFLNHLVTNRFRNVEVCREIFIIIKNDLYEHGIEFGSYESKVFSLRLLEVILKQYCGTSKGKGLSKNTDKSVNQKFKQYLKENDIWDITSSDIFHQLIQMANDTDNSDICTIAQEMLIEYFIKTFNVDQIQWDNCENFSDWIDVKVLNIFNIIDIELYHENINYWKMKFEYSGKGLLEAIDELHLRSNELKTSKDPVCAMQSGRSIFVLIDCINYSLSKINVFEAKSYIVQSITQLMKTITYNFLDFVNDQESCINFNALDKSLTHLIEKSSYTCENIDSLKQKLLLSFFFTFRALSELSRTIVKIMNQTTNSYENEHHETFSICIDINLQISSRFCHKGVIESASYSLGIITKMISTEFLQECDRNSQSARNLQTLLITLKHEIDCAKRHKSKTGEIRGSRGLLFRSHHIIKNHQPFLRFLMEKLLITKEIETFNDIYKIQFASDVQPIHLHLISILVKDSELVEEMLKYYDYILLATFKLYKESKNDYIIQNALLQIIGNLTTKIGNHKRHAIDETAVIHYEAKAISAYEFYVKMTYSYKMALVDLEINLNELSQTYIIILLEILSNFEKRKPNEHSTEIDRITSSFKTLMNHRSEKIRVLAAKCYAQWIHPLDLPKNIYQIIKNLFLSDANFVHGSIIAIRVMMERYEASIKCINKTFDQIHFIKDIRSKILESATLNRSSFSQNFFLKCYLLDLLLFVGFKFEDEIIEMLMDESNVQSKIGYTLWKEKIKQL
ncbi:hypothetical protein PVAND_001776 [Polypedilum vanderplanki]|uniref:Uncharacterized protein n=1 Tax=Polypedilum vanderplanki TaxID=319348 RepID=A0A9J6BPE1_POLVA|nr:hypothetical protein PVAND_001776 [Polypedilum vanderplanki]